MLLCLEHKEANPDGYAYTQFTRRYKAWERRLDVVMRQDHKAGERLLVDFPCETLVIYGPKTAQVAMQAEVFVAALGASGYVYAEASLLTRAGDGDRVARTALRLEAVRRPQLFC